MLLLFGSIKHLFRELLHTQIFISLYQTESEISVKRESFCFFFSTPSCRDSWVWWQSVLWMWKDFIWFSLRFYHATPASAGIKHMLEHFIMTSGTSLFLTQLITSLWSGEDESWSVCGHHVWPNLLWLLLGLNGKNDKSTFFNTLLL